MSINDYLLAQSEDILDVSSALQESFDARSLRYSFTETLGHIGMSRLDIQKLSRR